MWPFGRVLPDAPYLSEYVFVCNPNGSLSGTRADAAAVSYRASRSAWRLRIRNVLEIWNRR